jgi:hypothetical protein
VIVKMLRRHLMTDHLTLFLACFSIETHRFNNWKKKKVIETHRFNIYYVELTRYSRGRRKKKT